MNHIKKYFGHLLDPQLIIIVLVIIMGCVALKMFFTSKVSSFKEKYKVKFYIYLFSFLFVYAVVALMGYSRLFSGSNLYEYIFYQIASLSIGILHCFLYRFYLEKFDSQESLTEYLFAFLMAAFASIPFLLIYSFFNGTIFAYWMLGHFLWFFVPTLLNDTFNRAMNIPLLEYKSWQFPAGYEQMNVKDEEMKDLVLVTLYIEKTTKSGNFSSFRAKSPLLIDFGRLFYNFVLDYNEKHPDDRIQTEDEHGLCRWIFYLQPKWYEKTQFVDPKGTLFANNITENSVILCVRKEGVDSVENEADKKINETVYEYNTTNNNNQDNKN